MRGALIAILMTISLNGEAAPARAQPTTGSLLIAILGLRLKDVQGPLLKRPFYLTPAQERGVQEIIKRWQKSGYQQLTCKFTRWDYDSTFGPKNNDYLFGERHGEIKFRAPHDGSVKETEMKMYVPWKNSGDSKDRGHYEVSTDQLDYWVCNGEKLYQFKPQQKILEVTELPPDMRGKVITELILGFLLPEAKSVVARFWCRERTPVDAFGKQVWLELWPKTAFDANSFQKIEVILDQSNFRILAVQITTPNGRDRTAYLYEDWRIDQQAALFDADFRPPVPKGWKRIPSITPPAAQPVAPTVPAAISEEKPVKSVRKAVYSCRNRSRAKRCGLLKSRPGLPRFNRRGWVR